MSKRGPVTSIFPGSFAQLVEDLVAHRKKKAGPIMVIQTTKQPESKITKLRQAISRYAKK